MVRLVRRHRSVRVGLAAAAIAGAFLGLVAQPAGATNLNATDARSEVTSISPPSNSTHARILGGDAAIRVTADPGHEVIVLGYSGEPYLRIAADGTVSVNTSSPAFLLNRTRTGGTTSAATPGDTPTWTTIDGRGSVVWHDHRIHAMTSADQTHDWTIGLMVDGQPGQIDGRLSVAPGPSPIPWILLVVVLTGAVVLLGRRRPMSISVGSAAVAAALMLLEAVAVRQQTPATLGPDPLAIVVAGSALLAACVAAVTRSGVRRVCTAGALALAGGVTASMLPALTHSTVPGLGPAVVSRLVVSVCVGLIIGGAALLVIGAGRPESIRRPAPAAPPR